MVKRIFYPSPVMVNKIETHEHNLSSLNAKMNDLYYLFRSGSIIEKDFIKLKDKLNEKIIKLQKENKNGECKHQ
jgi:hypothetical protein